MNAALGNAGKTVSYTEPIEANPVNQMNSLRELVNDINAGAVELLVMLGGNPAYDAPADFEFGPTLLKAKLRVHSGLYYDETAELCHWHVPETHFLEAWSDGRAYDGTVGIVQPLIAPLYQGRSSHELIAALAGDSGKSGHDLVRDYWKAQRPEKDKAFEAFWERSLHDGVMAGTALPAIPVSPRSDLGRQPLTQTGDPEALEIVYRPDPTIGDGRFSNNGWLQETPKTITRLTWDNAALVSTNTAERMNLRHGEYVKLRLAGRDVYAGIFADPGHPDNSITLHLGYGRRRAGNVGNGQGFNAYFLRTSNAPWMATGLQLEDSGKKYYFAVQQYHYMMNEDHHRADTESVHAFRRELIQVATLEEFRKDPDFARHPATERIEGTVAVSAIQVRRIRVGDVDRLEPLHRVQCVRGGVPIGKQYRGGGKRSGGARAGDAVDSHRHVFPRQSGNAGNVFRAAAVHAMRERTVRSGVPGGSDVAQRGRLERNDVQPLRGDALLLE